MMLPTPLTYGFRHAVFVGLSAEWRELEACTSSFRVGGRHESLFPGVSRLVFSCRLLRPIIVYSDLALGCIYYRSEITLLAGWIHHPLYVAVVELAVWRSWTQIFCLPFIGYGDTNLRLRHCDFLFTIPKQRALCFMLFHDSNHTYSISSLVQLWYLKRAGTPLQVVPMSQQRSALVFCHCISYGSLDASRASYVGRSRSKLALCPSSHPLASSDTRLHPRRHDLPNLAIQKCPSSQQYPRHSSPPTSSSNNRNGTLFKSNDIQAYPDF
ncbi:hypothetical protein H2248_002504 [Termitomyces sp. 'cryptogamus']|nr:hypothetical protein H2248_002504 [Termitomyces sp. 'cryptogamus']